MALVECVPNFSEGRRPEVVTAIRDAVAAVPGVWVLDVSSDRSHNRTVITMVGAPDRIGDGALAGIREASRAIDLNAHEGCHPRMGAADVVPFVPLEGATMDDCVRIARDVGRRVADELEIPVYLYEHAALRPARRNLADVRRGGFEGLRERVASDPDARPDFGPARLHATCGAVAVGARDLLVAYNVFLGPAANMPVARDVARAVRASALGGLRGVKALAFEVDGQAQLSMNLVEPAVTTVRDAFERVRDEARRSGVEPTWSEIVGLVPAQALGGAAPADLLLRGFDRSRDTLEARIRSARSA